MQRMDNELDIFLDSTEKHNAKSKKSGSKKPAPKKPPQPEPKAGFSLGSWVLMLGIAVAAVVFGIQLANQNQIQPQPGDTAPDFALTTFDGQPLKLSDLRGKIVVVNFWASWCPPCRDEAPDLQAIWEDYGAQGVVVVGVAWLDADRDSRAFMTEFGMTYPNAPDTGEVVGKLYRITGAPENFVIDQNGVIAHTIVNPVTYDSLATLLDALLAKGGTS
jgi:cytochrome c biogenesis protein CcmG/thiol:disulfide interchange protein DsbE